MTGPEKDELHEAVKAAVDEAIGDRIDKAVEARMPEAIGEVLGPMIHAAVRADSRAWRRRAQVGFLILFLGIGYVVHDNRERSTRARSVVCQIITSGDSSAYAYQQEGTISRAQLRRALRQSAEYRALLGPAPACSTGLTPPPKRLPPAP